jgi:hypothetical protein
MLYVGHHEVMDLYEKNNSQAGCLEVQLFKLRDAWERASAQPSPGIRDSPPGTGKYIFLQRLQVRGP